mmetsp:Transcript_25205/g.56864  ORF Transcript_25205/g.56864 Transcript_25205/m.56864 type:complete len:90 (-) Transcript_25205:201-470(-)
MSRIYIFSELFFVIVTQANTNRDKGLSYRSLLKKFSESGEMYSCCCFPCSCRYHRFCFFVAHFLSQQAHHVHKLLFDDLTVAIFIEDLE